MKEKDVRPSPAKPVSESPAENLAASVVKELVDKGGNHKDVLLAAQSDLAPDGRFGEQWVLLDSQDLWVINRHNGTAELRSRFSLDQIEDARVERCVGNGLMQVTVNQQPHVLLHYSTELTDRFGRVAHYLHERAENGPDVPVPHPDAESRHCLVCGRFLVDPSSKVCPNCVQRGKIFKRLMNLARPYWLKLAIVVSLLLGGALSGSQRDPAPFSAAGRPGMVQVLSPDLVRLWRGRADHLVCRRQRRAGRQNHPGHAGGFSQLPGHVLRAAVQPDPDQPGTKPFRDHRPAHL